MKFSSNYVLSNIFFSLSSPLAFSWTSSSSDASSSCSIYHNSSSPDNCQNCGNCFNPGARSGVMCPGSQQGYYCSTEQGPSFGCLDWTFGSISMIAAENNFNKQTGDNVYFGVGTYGTSSDPQQGLGACYRLKVDTMDRELIVQSINTGSDVAGNQFDLQVGDGGAGLFNNCAGSSWSMFPGSTSSWGHQYGGVDHRSECANLPPYPQNSGPMKSAGDNLVTLCQYSFDKKTRYEGGQNPTLLDVHRVKCPSQLVALTQIQRSDEPSSYHALEGMRPSEFDTTAPVCNCEAGCAYCLTRMMDCRKPSGGFKDNVKNELMVKGYKLVQPCTSDGYTRIDVQCGCYDCYC